MLQRVKTNINVKSYQGTGIGIAGTCLCRQFEERRRGPPSEGLPLYLSFHGYVCMFKTKLIFLLNLLLSVLAFAVVAPASKSHKLNPRPCSRWTLSPHSSDWCPSPGGGTQGYFLNLPSPIFSAAASTSLRNCSGGMAPTWLL